MLSKGLRSKLRFNITVSCELAALAWFFHCFLGTNLRTVSKKSCFLN